MTTDFSPSTKEERTQTRRRLLQGAVGGIGAAALAGGSGLTFHQALAGNEDEDDGDSSGSGSGGDGHDNSGHGGGDEDETVVVTGEIPEGSIEIRIVSEDADGFQPNDLTVDLGQSVTFVNAHDDEHTATGSGFDTGEIDRGGTATVVLDEPGRFAYACNYHPVMTGTISVRDENGEVPEAPTRNQDVPADAIEVQIVNFAFEPASVTVPAGGTVVWINNDSAPHTATGLDGEFDSDILDPGASFAWEFTEPGAVAYQCSLHPAMQGTVEVTGEPESGDAATTVDTDTDAGIAGVWIVTVEPDLGAGISPQRALATFDADGSVSATFASAESEEGTRVDLSDAHGTWEASDGNGFTATIAAMSLTVDRLYTGLVTIAVDGQLDETGNSFTGQFSFEATDANGELQPSTEGTIEGTRIGADDSEAVESAATPASAGDSATVTIRDFTFDPADIEVPAGSSVTWQNEDDAPHTATADDGAFDTGRLDQGGSGGVTFDQPGAYPYRCDFHPDMVGTVTVT
jgi:plastocyanin